MCAARSGDARGLFIGQRSGGKSPYRPRTNLWASRDGGSRAAAYFPACQPLTTQGEEAGHVVHAESNGGGGTGADDGADGASRSEQRAAADLPDAGTVDGAARRVPSW